MTLEKPSKNIFDFSLYLSHPSLSIYLIFAIYADFVLKASLIEKASESGISRWVSLSPSSWKHRSSSSWSTQSSLLKSQILNPTFSAASFTSGLQTVQILIIVKLNRSSSRDIRLTLKSILHPPNHSLPLVNDPRMTPGWPKDDSKINPRWPHDVLKKPRDDLNFLTPFLRLILSNSRYSFC